MIEVFVVPQYTPLHERLPYDFGRENEVENLFFLKFLFIKKFMVYVIKFCTLDIPFQIKVPN